MRGSFKSEDWKGAIPIQRIIDPLYAILGFDTAMNAANKVRHETEKKIREQWNQKDNDHNLDETIRDIAIHTMDMPGSCSESNLAEYITRAEKGLEVLFQPSADNETGPWSQHFVNENYRHIITLFEEFRQCFESEEFDVRNYHESFGTLKAALREMKNARMLMRVAETDIDLDGPPIIAGNFSKEEVKEIESMWIRKLESSQADQGAYHENQD